MNAPSSIQVQVNELNTVLGLLRQHVPDCEVWAFGSRAGGTPKPFSDLDLVIVGPEPLSLAARADLSHAFSESDLPWKVDLVDWHSISPAFKKIIQTNYQVLQTPSSIKPSK